MFLCSLDKVYEVNTHTRVVAMVYLQKYQTDVHDILVYTKSCRPNLILVLNSRQSQSP